MKKITFLFLALLCSGLMSAEIIYDVKIGDLYYNLNTTTQTAQVSGIVNGFSGDLVIPDSVKFGNPYANLNIESPAEGYVTLVIEIPEGSACNGIAFKGTLDGSWWTGANEYLGEYGPTTVSQCIQFELISGTTNLYKATFRLGDEAWGEEELMSGKICLIYANDASWQGQATDWSAESFSTAGWGRSSDGNILIYSSGIVYMHIDGWQDTECASYSNYNLTVHVPNMCIDFNLEVIGSFCNWDEAQTVAMTQVSNGVYTATITASENAQWKVRGVGDWGKEIQYYDDEDEDLYSRWKAVPNNVLGTNLNVTVDYSDNEMYRWSICAEEEEIPRRLNATNQPHRTQINMQTFHVTSIGDGAFNDRRGLTSVTIPMSVDTIFNYAFHNCTGLNSVTWNAKHCVYGYYQEYWNSNLGYYYSWHDNTECLFPSSVQTVTFGNQVESITAGLCRGMNQLSSITLPNSLTYIGDYAFKGTGLTSINLPNNLTRIGAYAFEDTGLSSITLPNNLTYIGEAAFEGTGLSSVTLPNNLTYIGASAFRGTGLNSIVIPENVTYVGGYAFFCDNLSLVIWNARNCKVGNSSIQYTYWSSTGGPFNTSVQTFIFGDHVQSIPDFLCSHLHQLTSISLPNTITEIGKSAFWVCSGLISFTMEDGVQTIGAGAFSECSNLPQIALPNTVTSIGNSAFEDCSNLTTATIGNSVDTIGARAFSGCERLISIELPATVNEIGDGAFLYCSAMNKAIVHSTVQLNSNSGLMYNAQLDTVIAPASIFDVAEESWPACTKKIKYVLVNSGELTENGFAVIRRSASTLETLDVAATTNTTMADEAFSNMYNLTTLALPQNLERISYMAVAGCKMLSSISIPASVTEIGTSAFEHCRSLQTVTFNGNNLTTIGNWAFYNNHALRQITIPSGVTTIGAGAFYGCTYLEDLAMPATLRNVGDNAFALCNHLTKMQVEADLPPMVAARTFFDVSRNIPVFVPDASVNDYRTTAVWQEFNIRPISQAATGIETVRESDSDSQDEMLPDGKFFQDGKLLIRRNGKTYDAQGRLIQ